METKEKPVERQVTYTAGPGDPMAVDWHGMRFVSGVPRPVSDLAILDQVATNPHFAIDGQDKVKEREERMAKEADLRGAEAKAIRQREGEEMRLRHEAELARLKQRHDSEKAQFESHNDDDALAQTRGSREHDADVARASSDRIGGGPTPSTYGALAPMAKAKPDPDAGRAKKEADDAKNQPELGKPPAPVDHRPWLDEDQTLVQTLHPAAVPKPENKPSPGAPTPPVVDQRVRDEAKLQADQIKAQREMASDAAKASAAKEIKS